MDLVYCPWISLSYCEQPWRRLSSLHSSPPSSLSPALMRPLTATHTDRHRKTHRWSQMKWKMVRGWDEENNSFCLSLHTLSHRSCYKVEEEVLDKSVPAWTANSNYLVVSALDDLLVLPYAPHGNDTSFSLSRTYTHHDRTTLTLPEASLKQSAQFIVVSASWPCSPSLLQYLFYYLCTVSADKNMCNLWHCYSREQQRVSQCKQTVKLEM